MENRKIILFLQIVSWDLILFFVVKEWRQFKRQKSPLCFEVIPCNNKGNFFTTR